VGLFKSNRADVPQLISYSEIRLEWLKDMQDVGKRLRHTLNKEQIVIRIDM
jgi:hypothetical protein